MGNIAGSLAALIAAIIEASISDAFYQQIIANMQADDRQTLTDEERAQIKAHLDAGAKAAQDAIDAM